MVENEIQENLQKDKDNFKVDLDELRRRLQVDKGLSERECDVFFVVGSGCNNLEAAEKLFVAEGTVKFHLTNVFRKLGVKSRSRIVLLAHGLDSL